MRDRLLTRLGELTVRHPWMVVFGAVVLTVASGLLMPALEMYTSRSALYPDDIDVNRRFQEFLDDFKTPSNLIAVLEGEPEELGPFADDLAAAFRARTDFVGDVFYKADVEFFADRAFLFLSVDQLRKLRDKVLEEKDGVTRINRLNGLVPLLEAFGGTDAETAFKEKIDISSGKQIIAAGRELVAEMDAWLSDPGRKEVRVLENLFVEQFSGRGAQDRHGYLKSRDGRLLFLFIQPSTNDDEFEYLEGLLTSCRSAAREVSDRWTAEGRSPPTLGFTGLPAQSVEEMVSIQHDVMMTASVAAVAILLIILVGFRSIRRGLIIFVPLVLAGLWNLGLTALTIGHLTLLTSGFTAILFGLGVDYGIFVTGRIQEELARGASDREAILTALRTSGRTLLTAGGTTAAAFFVMGTVEFKGFAELGIVAGTGVLLALLAFLVLLPALSALVKVPRSKSLPARAESSERRPPLLFAAVVTLAGLAAAGLSLYFATQVPMDFDLRNIMPRDSESVKYQLLMADRSDFQPEFAAVTAADVEEARTLADRFSKLSTVSRVESITNLVPTDQEEKVRLIREVEPVFDRILVPRGDFEPFEADELADQLDDLGDVIADAQERTFSAGQKELTLELDRLATLLEQVSEKLRKDPGLAGRAREFEKELFATVAGAVDVVKRWTRMGAMAPDDLPQGILDRFRSRTGKYAVFVFPAGSIYDVDFLDRFLHDVYAISPTATGFPTTHHVFSRMSVDGFRQASLYAVLVVLVLLLVDFRRLGLMLGAALPLGVGAAWMFGLMYFLKMPYNYANIIALPLVIGLAVDYGVYITHRLAEAGRVHPFATMVVAGKPVLMAALTTMAGIGAICLGQHQGAVSLGQALLCGIATCLLAALVVLPSAAAVVQELRGGSGRGQGGDRRLTGNRRSGTGRRQGDGAGAQGGTEGEGDDAGARPTERADAGRGAGDGGSSPSSGTDD